MYSNDGCPVLSLHSLQDFLVEYKAIVGVILIAGGIWLLIYGGQKFQITMFLAG
jgi:hypothetical protein